MVLNKGTCLKFYKQESIQEAIVEHAQNKEIGVRYNNGFGKRPDILTYPGEVLELAKQGVTSIHSSEELWDNPLSINSNLKRKELDELRSGWDLVLDIDCKFVEYSKISANLIIKFLQYMGVKNISVKFSGNKGFHIGVPFEAFPSKIGDKETKNLFPEAPKKIAHYIKENIQEELSKRILQFENNSFEKVQEKVELKFEDIVRHEKNQFGDQVIKLDVDKFLEIDTVLISSRHLYRMPYSLHEKSGLVSLPIDPNKVMEFKKPNADPLKVKVSEFKFLDREVKEKDNARLLLIQSLDFDIKEKKQLKEKEEQKKEFKEDLKIESPIREEFFPPCISGMLRGMEDGKKRAVFCLINYLGKIGWNKHEIREYLNKWNREKNEDPLRDNYLEGQLRYFKAGEKLPPNCDNEAYYLSLGTCKPNELCKRIKNPVNHTLILWKKHLKLKEEQEEQEKKELAKKMREEKKKEVVERRKIREGKKIQKDEDKFQKDIKKNNLVNVEEHDFLIETEIIKKYSNRDKIYLNKKAIVALVKAKENLPKNYNFIITYGYRTLDEQKKIVKDMEEELKESHPDNWEALLNEYTGGHEELKLKKFSAMNHRSGKAVDLKLAFDNQEVDLGDVSYNKKDNIDYYENLNKELTERAEAIKKNRRLLKETLEKHGFKNYPKEWWHWGYVGDEENN